jgi:hypothetical protein
MISEHCIRHQQLIISWASPSGVAPGPTQVLLSDSEIGCIRVLNQTDSIDSDARSTGVVLRFWHCQRICTYRSKTLYSRSSEKIVPLPSSLFSLLEYSGSEKRRVPSGT